MREQEDDDIGVEVTDVQVVTDDELADEFEAYDEHTGQYARSARLTPEQRRRVLTIVITDYQEAFDLDVATVRRVKRIVRGRPGRNSGSGGSTPRNKASNHDGMYLRVVVRQPLSRGLAGVSVHRAIRIIGVAPGPRVAL